MHVNLTWLESQEFAIKFHCSAFLLISYDKYLKYIKIPHMTVQDKDEQDINMNKNVKL